MPALLLTWIPRLLPYLLVLIVAGVGYWKAQHWCNAECRVHKSAASILRGQLAELDRQRIQQQERWAQATAAEEQRTKERDEKRKLAFLGMVERARSDSRAADIRIPSTSLGVLADAHAAAEPTRPAEVPTDPAKTDTPASEVIVWGVEILDWSAECRDRVTAWERFYQSLRNAN